MSRLEELILNQLEDQLKGKTFQRGSSGESYSLDGLNKMEAEKFQKNREQFVKSMEAMKRIKEYGFHKPQEKDFYSEGDVFGVRKVSNTTGYSDADALGIRKATNNNGQILFNVPTNKDRKYFGSQQHLKDMISGNIPKNIREVIEKEKNLNTTNHENYLFLNGEIYSVHSKAQYHLRCEYPSSGRPMLTTKGDVSLPLGQGMNSSEVTAADLIALGFSCRAQIMNQNGAEVLDLSNELKIPKLKDFNTEEDRKIVEEHLEEIAKNPEKIANVTRFVVNQSPFISGPDKEKIGKEIEKIVRMDGPANLKIDRLRLLSTELETNAENPLSTVDTEDSDLQRATLKNTSTMLKHCANRFRNRLGKIDEGYGYDGKQLSAQDYFTNIRKGTSSMVAQANIVCSVRNFHNQMNGLPKVGLTNSSAYNKMLQSLNGFDRMEEFRSIMSKKHGKEYTLEEATKMRLDVAINTTQEYVNAKIGERLPKGTTLNDLQQMRNNGNALKADQLENKAIQKIMSDQKVANRFYNAREMLDRLRFAQKDLVNKMTNKKEVKENVKTELNKNIQNNVKRSIETNQKTTSQKHTEEQLKKQQAARKIKI